MNSLERSLQLGLVTGVLLLMLVFWWGGTLTVRLLSESFVYERLQADATSVRDAWLVARPVNRPSRPRGWPGQPAFRLYPEYDRPASGHYYEIRFVDGERILSRSAWEQSLDFSMLQPGESLRRRTTGRAGEPLQLWLGGFSAGGRDATIAVASDVSAIDRRLVIVRWLLLGFSALLLGALLAVQRAIVRRSVARLDRIRADVERLGHGEIVALREDVPDEVRPLVIEFNRLLGRFEQRLQQSRNAVGNLAHALKGPLNLLVRAADDRAVDEPVRQNAERIRQLIEGELRRARLVGRTSAGRRFDLAAEVEALAGLLKQVHAEKELEVRLSIGADVTIVHDRQDMLELIGNLIDNAAKWARSLVMVNARSSHASSGDGLLLEFEDDGPGVSDDAIRELTGRGVRLDESVAGHGLGLGIVRDIVASYGGELELGRSNRLGGFRAAVRLPDRAQTGEIPGS